MCGQTVVPTESFLVNVFVELLDNAQTLDTDRPIINEFNFGRIVAIFFAAFDHLESFATDRAQNRTTIAKQNTVTNVKNGAEVRVAAVCVRLNNTKLSMPTFDRTSNHEPMSGLVHIQWTRDVWICGCANENRHRWLVLDFQQLTLLECQWYEPLHCHLNETCHRFLRQRKRH